MREKKEGGLWDQYRLALSRVWKDGGKKGGMFDYCLKKTDFLVELEDGSILPIDKERIETSFCFGYGYCGRSTEEEEMRASDMAERVEKDGGVYFMKENLKGINNRIKDLEGHLKLFIIDAYWDQPENPRLSSYMVLWHDIDRYESTPGFREAGNSDRERILAGLKKERDSFTKRLETYLKRYGTSKLRTWTYLSD